MRTIDGDALMEILTTAIRNMKGMAKFLDAEDDPEIQMEIKAYTDIANGVKDMPTIEPKRKKGKWIPQDHNKSNGMVSTLVFYYPKCSECGHSGNYDMNFCPNCGADMRGEQNE